MFDIGSELFPLLVERNLPFTPRPAISTGSTLARVSDLLAVCQRVLRGEIAQMDMPGHEVRPGVWVGLNTALTGIRSTSPGRFALVLAPALNQA